MNGINCSLCRPSLYKSSIWVLDENITEAEYTAAQELTPPTYAATSTWKASYTCEDYQGVDQSKLVPLITAALQEAVGKIETLETKVAALEAA